MRKEGWKKKLNIVKGWTVALDNWPVYNTGKNVSIIYKKKKILGVYFTALKSDIDYVFIS